MKIDEVLLNPFGCITNKFVFQEGVNTLYGPNEAGKSTIFNAIEKVLFTPSNLRKGTKNFEELKKWFPVGGGDTISVAIKFSHDGQSYSLLRSWGEDKRDELILPSGGKITNIEEIKNVLESLLLANEGAYKSVLLTYQSGLSQTIEQLRKNRDTLDDMGGIIRKTFMETDGVNIDKFKAILEREYDKYFDYWEIESNTPTKKGGVSYYTLNRYGELGKAFIELEEIKEEYDKIKTQEEKMNDTLKEISEIEEKVSSYKEFLKEFEIAYNYSKEIDNIQKGLPLLKVNKEKKEEDLEDWVGIENRRDAIEKEIPKKEGEIEQKTKEYNQAKEIEISRKLKEGFRRLKSKKEEMGIKEAELQTSKIITKNDIEELRDINDKLEIIKIKSESQKFTANFSAKKSIEIDIKKGLENFYSKSLDVNQSIKIDVGGKLTIRHPDWSLDVYPGETEIDKLAEDYQIGQREFNDCLDSLKVKTLEEAEKLSDIYLGKLRAYEDSKIKYDSELEGLNAKSFEELEGIVKKSIDQPDAKDPSEINKEIGKLEMEIGGLRTELGNISDIIKEYQDKYQSIDNLKSDIGQDTLSLKEIANKISNIPPLPEGIDKLNDFIEIYELKGKNCRVDLDSLNTLRLDYQGFDNSDKSSEELEEELKDKTIEFEEKLKIADSVKHVRDLSYKLLDEIDTNPNETFIKKVEGYFSFLTNGKYTKIISEDYLPEKIIQEDGISSKELEHVHLSAGTMDALALSLRLAMADYFLDKGGFMIMDDPLVDMDPQRQMKASELIRNFAEERQVIVFTCHPGHAEMIGGKSDL